MVTRHQLYQLQFWCLQIASIRLSCQATCRLFFARRAVEHLCLPVASIRCSCQRAACLRCFSSRKELVEAPRSSSFETFFSCRKELVEAPKSSSFETFFSCRKELVEHQQSAHLRRFFPCKKELVEVPMSSSFMSFQFPSAGNSSSRQLPPACSFLADVFAPCRKFFQPTTSSNFPTVKARHIRVSCSFLEVTRAREGELLLALYSINRLTRVHVLHTMAHDIFLMQKFGMSDKETLLRHMPEEDKKWMEVVMAKEKKGRALGAWYNVPMQIMAQLVFKEEYSTQLSLALSKIERNTLTLEEYTKRVEDTTKTIEGYYVNKAYKVAAIANPINGEGFFQILYRIDWDCKTNVVTEDKLQAVATSSVGPTKKKEILAILTSVKSEREAVGMSSDNKGFRRYMAKETYWSQLIEAARLLVSGLSNEDGSQLPDDQEIFFRRQRSNHFHFGFIGLQKDMKNSASQDKQPQLHMSARRLVFRWIVYLMEENKIDKLIDEVVEWCSFDGPHAMYPVEWKDLGISNWELERCPWWLDYPDGQIPKMEKTLYAEWQATKAKSTAEMGSASKKQTQTEAEEERERRSKRKLDMSSKMKMDKGGPMEEGSGETNEVEPGDIQITLANVKNMGTDENHKAWKKIRQFCSSKAIPGLTLKGKATTAVARLVWADFPTSLGVQGLEDEESIPEWNSFGDRLAGGVATIANAFVADQGWFVSLSLTDHLVVIDKWLTDAGFKYDGCMHVFCNAGYLRFDPDMTVSILTMAFYHRSGYSPVALDKEAAERVDKKDFAAGKDWVNDAHPPATKVEGKVVRGGAERSIWFYRYLVELSTKPGDVILDIFAGTGNLAQAAAAKGRHNFSMEKDKKLIKGILRPLESKGEKE